MSAPLAERMRPRTLDEVQGQERWLEAGAPLRQAAESGRLGSIVLWGPPGCGKTTIARLLAGVAKLQLIQLSAVLAGVGELRKIIANSTGSLLGTPMLFVDEIHRWNKAQQDALLPHIESGALVLVGATTENPAFSLNPALRSRLQIVRLDPVRPELVADVLREALESERGLGGKATVASEVVEALAHAAGGDVRRALTDLETLVAAAGTEPITLESAKQVLSESRIRHDRGGDDHYDVLSALIKSLRGSDPHAAIYWLARLLTGGEDPRAISRRLVIFASEDVGNADPRALSVAVDAARACEFVGMPEIRIVLAQCVTWLATCPKSNASYVAINEAMELVQKHGALGVPLHLRSSSTSVQREQGFGAGYLYPHDHPHHIVQQEYLPAALSEVEFYAPAAHGDERTIRERMAWWKKKLR